MPTNRICKYLEPQNPAPPAFVPAAFAVMPTVPAMFVASPMISAAQAQIYQMAQAAAQQQAAQNAEFDPDWFSP